MCRIFQYQDKGVTFFIEKPFIEVNATELGRISGADPSAWLNLPETQFLINETKANILKSSDYMSDREPVSKCDQKASHTLMHSSLAVRFAYWCDPNVGNWCLEQLNTLLPVPLPIPQEALNSLLPINKNGESRTVSARYLHAFLEVKTDFTNWCKRMFEYGFEKNVDYTLAKIGERNAHNKTDYALTLDTAKEISMLQRTDRGKMARQYFIACEKVALSVQKPASLPSNKELALMVIEAEEKAEKLQLENSKLRPRSEFVDKVFDSSCLITIGQTAKVLKLPYGRNILFKTLREKGVFFKNSNEPKQEFVSKGYFEIKEQAIEVKGKQKIVMQTYTTQKGLAFIAKILGVVTVPGYVTPIIH